MDKHKINELQKITFKDTWNLKWHSQFSEDWSVQSFKDLYTIKTQLDINYLFNTYQPDIDKLSLYIFRNNISPVWEDKSNQNGGFISFRVETQNIETFWNQLILIILNESLFIDENLNDQKLVNGIQLTQKFFDQKQNDSFQLQTQKSAQKGFQQGRSQYSNSGNKYKVQYPPSSIVKIWIQNTNINFDDQMYRYPKISGMEPPRYKKNNIINN